MIKLQFYFKIFWYEKSWKNLFSPNKSSTIIKTLIELKNKFPTFVMEWSNVKRRKARKTNFHLFVSNPLSRALTGDAAIKQEDKVRGCLEFAQLKRSRCDQIRTKVASTHCNAKQENQQT